MRDCFGFFNVSINEPCNGREPLFVLFPAAKIKLIMKSLRGPQNGLMVERFSLIVVLEKCLYTLNHEDHVLLRCYIEDKVIWVRVAIQCLPEYLPYPASRKGRAGLRA